MQNPDRAQVVPVAGDGVVVRTESFVAVLGADARSLVPDVLVLEESIVVPEDMPRRGRYAVRAFAQLAALRDAPVTAAFAAPDGVGIGVYLSGAVFAEIDGRRVEPPVGAVFDRALPWPVRGIGLYLAGATPAPLQADVFDLTEGCVPGGGALLLTPLGMAGTRIDRVSGPIGKVAPAAPDDPAPHEPDSDGSAPDGPTDAMTDPRLPAPGGAEEPPAEPPAAAPEALGDDPQPVRRVGPTVPRPPADRPPLADGLRVVAHPPVPNPRPMPFQSASLGGEDEPARPPLPKAAPPRSGRSAALPRPPRSSHAVHGIRCSRGHLNHPEAWICAACGIRMDQLTGVVVVGERPPLGWLLLDNGATLLLDEDLVIGREPTPSGEPAPGGKRAVVIPDDTGQLSRRHVEIRLAEWVVYLVDLASANGTFVTQPGVGTREFRIPPNVPHPLVPGSNVRIGARHFIFESPHARI